MEDLLKNKALLSMIIFSLIFFGNTKFKLPNIIVNLFQNDIIKVLLLVLIYKTQKINYALILAILFIILIDKLNDKDIENFNSKL